MMYTIKKYLLIIYMRKLFVLIYKLLYLYSTIYLLESRVNDTMDPVLARS